MNHLVTTPEPEMRERRVKLAQDLYPALFDRVKQMCDGAASDVDVEHHAASIVLSANQKGTHA